MADTTAGLQVDPVRVINILKARLVEEVSKTAVLEAALQESQVREQALAEVLGQMQAASEAQKEATPKDTEG
jgi:alpha-D-ribose 1-methylphosphonate 5-triphosphate synthase subunit PhnG